MQRKGKTRKIGFAALESELSRLQKLCRMGFQVKVEWLPGKMKRYDGKQLAEEVISDTIFIYARDQQEALCLVAHGFSEWLLNTHSRPYREMINMLIGLFELEQYQSKEKIVGVFERLFRAAV
jgi:hypothetical protein